MADSLSLQLPFTNADPAYAMAEFEQILASNSGEDPFESAIKLLAAKLLDEIESRANSPSRFAIHANPQTTHKAVQDLYRRALRRWPHLNGNGNSLGISPQHLVRSIRPLLGWRLLGSDLSFLDAALERLVARDSKGELGQYFTPRDIVRLCVSALNPGPRDKVLDPACGSGGFLFESARHSLSQHGVAPASLGIDFGARAIKVAALLAVANPDSRIQVSKANSIDGREIGQHSIRDWKEFIGRDNAARTHRAQSWGAWNKLTCSVLLTNPPFAGSMDEPDVLDAYEAQQDPSLRRNVSREHLFLERAVHLTKPGGRLAIVLPQGLLANASASYLRTWLLKRCRILGVIGLHPHAFLPYTSVKTSLVFAIKHRPEETPKSDYPIFFATSKKPGKESSGRQSGTSDYGTLAHLLSLHIAAQKYDWAPRVRKTNAPEDQYEIVPYSEVSAADRLDAEYYDPVARGLLKRIHKDSDRCIGHLVNTKIERFKKGYAREILYLDISSVDVKTGLAFPSLILASEAPSRAAYLVQQGDVLVSTVRPDRNVVALVTGSGSTPIVASNGFCVLRPRAISPETLFAYCKTEAFRRMLSRHATASMYPTVTDKDVLGVPFLELPADTARQISKLVRSSLEMIESANRQVAQAVALIGHHVDRNKSGDDISESPSVLQQITANYKTGRQKRRTRSL